MGIIEQHETFNVIDSTKLTDYMTCPRMYFFKYGVGWQQKEKSHDLVYGSAIHEAMNILCRLRRGKTERILTTRNNPHRVDDEVFKSYPPNPAYGYPFGADEFAFEAFSAYYNEFYSSITELSAEKTRGNAIKILTLYCQHYSSDDFETLHTEVAFRVPISKTHYMYGKIDAVIKDKQGKIWILEHKTTKRLGRQWEDQFPLSLQINLYVHVLYCMYPREQVGGAIINGFVFNKTQVQLIRLIQRKTPDMMNAWVFDTTRWIDDLISDHELLIETQNDLDHPMQCFPRNTTNCTKYWGCPFHDYCRIWANPLKHSHEIPFDFEKRYWDPRDHELKAREVVRL